MLADDASNQLAIGDISTVKDSVLDERLWSRAEVVEHDRHVARSGECLRCDRPNVSGSASDEHLHIM